MWVQLILFVVATLIQAALAPRQQQQNAEAADNFTAPTAQEGHPIPVVFGEVLLQAPNVVWYGDIEAEPIYSGGGGKK